MASSPRTDQVPTGPTGENWARNHRYQSATLLRPTSLAELQEVVAVSPTIRALGSRHSFNDLADSRGSLVSLDSLPAEISIDESRRTVTAAAGLRYGDLASVLQDRGWALHNLASLPHISLAGATATGTHGSGDTNGTLAAAVAGIELVGADGELLRLARGDADFDGAVVSLGALGVLTSVTIDIQPSFQVRQDLFDGLPWSTFLSNFDAITSSAYSVSIFTDWLGDTIGTSWLKSRLLDAAPPEEFFGATRHVVGRHMLPDAPASNTTTQGGVAGPWNERLAHFKLGFTPSIGDEIQSEYLVPRANAVAAIEAMRTLGSRIAPLLLITELRTMCADTLWLSGAEGTDAVGIHFTWKPLAREVASILPDIEALLLPLGARPHWGKAFAATRADLEPLYPRMADFRALASRMDPEGKFRNEYLERCVFGG
ncbi:MAG: FAD-binding protein [Microbacteriaceae bacterium]|nr:FAD-binding protein [Microbacteriaceae bacterium]